MKKLSPPFADGPSKDQHVEVESKLDNTRSAPSPASSISPVTGRQSPAANATNAERYFAEFTEHQRRCPANSRSERRSSSSHRICQVHGSLHREGAGMNQGPRHPGLVEAGYCPKKEFVLSALRATLLRVRLIETELESAGVALKGDFIVRNGVGMGGGNRAWMRRVCPRDDRSVGMIDVNTASNAELDQLAQNHDANQGQRILDQVYNFLGRFVSYPNDAAQLPRRLDRTCARDAPLGFHTTHCLSVTRTGIREVSRA